MTSADDLLRKLEPILKDKTLGYWFFSLLNVLTALFFRLKIII